MCKWSDSLNLQYCYDAMMLQLLLPWLLLLLRRLLAFSFVWVSAEPNHQPHSWLICVASGHGPPIEHTGFMFCCGRRTLPNHPSRFPAVWLGGKYVYCVWPGRISTATPTTTTTTANTALGARSHLTVCFQHKDHRRRYNNDKSGMEVGGGAGGMYVRKGYGKVGGRTHNG